MNKTEIKIKLSLVWQRIVLWLQNMKLVMKNKLSQIEGKKVAYWTILSLFVLIVVGFLGVFVVFAYFSKDLPSPTKVVRHDGYASQIYDRNGALLYDVYKDAKRKPVEKSADIPDNLKKAVVSVEDKDFYKHAGFDPMAPLRIVKNLFVMHRLTGGSTLTQQLVKNVLLTNDRTITRKIKEFILAVQIDKKYSKDEVLQMYLNEAPYGGSLWGVGAAAEQYFGKDVKDLTLTECVILAGIPQSPNHFSPFSNTPTEYIARTAHVLERMKEDGYISDATAKDTLSQVKVFKFHENKTTINAPHFVFWIKDQLTQKYGADVVEGGGLKVTTTLDLDLQNQAQKIVSDEIDKSEKLGISNGASIIVNPKDGEVLAMVGSRGYYSDKTAGKFNVVTQGLRQPGSSIKPVTYLMGLKKGYAASTMFVDAPVTFPGGPGQKDYSPQNYTGKFNGPMSLRNALGNSINTIAVKMLADVGVENMLTQAYNMGLTTLEPTKENLSRFGLAVTLGGAEVHMSELAQAYSAFANGGKKVELTGVLKVQDNSGRVLEEFKPFEGKSVMTPQEAFVISNILSDNSARSLTFGVNNSLVIPNYQVAVKTGTTNDKRDNWTIGWTPNLLAVAWVGNNDNSPMGNVASGVSGAAPIWRKIMLYELPKRPKEDFSIPDRIVAQDVDLLSGYPAHDGFSSKSDYFVDGTQPRSADPIHLKAKICKGQAGLATPDDVANGNYDEKEYVQLKENDPVSTDGRNRWQEGIDQWISQQSNKDLYNAPTGYCHSGGLAVVGFDTPSDQATVGSNFDVKINSSSVSKIVEVHLWADGQEKKIWSDRPFEVNINLPDGPHTLKVQSKDKDGNTAEKEIHIGVNVPWNWSPSPTNTPTPIASPTPLPTSAVVPTVGTTLP